MNELLERQLERTARIAVFGDAMIDEYYDVVADRVSPDFPIPVMIASSGAPNKVSLGGAGNVCQQFSNFNFDVDLFALVDERFIGEPRGFDVSKSSVIPTNVPVKKRFYSGCFPLCRLDVESCGYGLTDSELKELQGGLVSRLVSSDPYDVAILSDYDKGVFYGVDSFLEMMSDSTITIVDPKKSPVRRWKGCTIIKPNASEARSLSGRSDWKEQCQYFFRETDCQAVVITQAGEGVVGNVMGSWFEYRPKRRGESRSVIGAGDAFVAFLAMCMAHSIDIRRAVEIAFEACSIYVGKDRSDPVYPYEIEANKFVRPESLANRDFRLSFANGCFDILHPGHVELLEFAKSRGDRLVVALNSDKSVVAQEKSHPMVNDLEYRMRMVASLACVDFVVSFDDDTPHDLIKAIRPDVLVKGSEWPSPVGSDIVGEVCSFGLFGGYSTTGIINKISSLNPR